jgi:hypothetical protein
MAGLQHRQHTFVNGGVCCNGDRGLEFRIAMHYRPFKNDDFNGTDEKIRLTIITSGCGEVLSIEVFCPEMERMPAFTEWLKFSGLLPEDNGKQTNFSRSHRIPSTDCCSPTLSAL